MMRCIRSTSPAVLAGLLALGAAAHASEPHPYGGVSVSHNLASWDEGGVAGRDLAVGQRGFGVFGGYSFGPHFAAEVDLEMFPDHDVNVSETDARETGGWDVGVSGLALYPVSQSSDVYVRLGVHRYAWTTERRGAVERHDEASGIGLAFGGGVQSRIWNRGTVGLEYRARGFEAGAARHQTDFDWLHTLQVRFAFH